MKISLHIRDNQSFARQLEFVILVGAALVLLHLQFSGWGITGYLSTLGKQTELSQLWGYNIYNFPQGVYFLGIHLSGYQVTNIMHGLGNAWLLILIDLFVFGFASTGLLLALISTMMIENAWEYWEILSGTTACHPELFSTIQQTCAEMMNIVKDQQLDVIWGQGFALIAFAILWYLHHRKKRNGGG